VFYADVWRLDLGNIGTKGGVKYVCWLFEPLLGNKYFGFLVFALALARIFDRWGFPCARVRTRAPNSTLDLW
jgi:hypothetical protein